MDKNTGRTFDWDDEIENDGSDYVLLPKGDYKFSVSAFERKRYEPKSGAKIPACNQAVLHITIDNAPEGSATIMHNLFLFSTVEWRLSEFFRAIGQKKHGERLKMDWNAVVGTSGHCKVGVRTFTKKDGTEGKSNEIIKFYDPEDNIKGRNEGTAAAPTQQRRWKAGAF